MVFSVTWRFDSVQKWVSVELFDAQLVILEPDLHGLAEQLLGDFFQHFVMARHRHQLGVELAAEDAGGRQATGPGQRPAALRRRAGRRRPGGPLPPAKAHWRPAPGMTETMTHG